MRAVSWKYILGLYYRATIYIINTISRLPTCCSTLCHGHLCVRHVCMPRRWFWAVIHCSGWCMRRLHLVSAVLFVVNCVPLPCEDCNICLWRSASSSDAVWNRSWVYAVDGMIHWRPAPTTLSSSASAVLYDVIAGAVAMLLKRVLRMALLVGSGSCGWFCAVIGDELGEAVSGGGGGLMLDIPMHVT